MVLGILIGALAGAAIGVLTGDEGTQSQNHLPGPSSPYSDDSADMFDNDGPHSCLYCRRLVIDPAKAQRKTDSRLRRRLCGCPDCKWWLDEMVEKYGDPLFMQFNGRYVVEALANECETAQRFFGLGCEDLVKMHYSGKEMDLTDLSVCCAYRKDDIKDLTRLEFLGPHLRSKAPSRVGGSPEQDHYAIVAQPGEFLLLLLLESHIPIQHFLTPLFLQMALQQGLFRIARSQGICETPGFLGQRGSG